MKSASCPQLPLWNDRLVFLMFNPSPLVSIFFFFFKDNISVKAMQQRWVFFSGEIWTMRFYWKLNAYSYPAPAPSQQSLTWNTQVIAQTLLGYSMFNIRIALKFLMELPPQQARKCRNTELQEMASTSQDLASCGGKQRVFSPSQRNIITQPVTLELLKTKTDHQNQKYDSSAVS